jgi:hypothetical protein
MVFHPVYVQIVIQHCRMREPNQILEFSMSWIGKSSKCGVSRNLDFVRHGVQGKVLRFWPCGK